MPTMQFGEAADYGVFAAPHESSRRCDPARLLRLDRNLCAPAPTRPSMRHRLGRGV